MSSHIFLGLVHYPVYNKNLETIATSVTNLDIHDIARITATYNLNRYFLIHPLPTQHRLVSEIMEYWQRGYGSQYNPDRKKALDLLDVRESIEAVREEIQHKFKESVYTVVTDARAYPNTVSYLKMRSVLEESGGSYLLLFGTGWGMTKEVMEKADYVLEPVYGRGDYNHLSVRSAVAIILDRLLGDKWWK
jgi:hypothetical protein